jgi:MFS family permease
VADLAPKELRGEAFGWYNGAIGIAALPASALFGLIWVKISLEAAFITGAALALLASVFLFTIPRKPE